MVTEQTKALFYNLKQVADTKILFGHEDATAYGIGWKSQPHRSDIKSVCGSFPAVYGWDLGDIELGYPENLDGVNFDEMRKLIQEAYARGGIITISWHQDNPVSGGDSWDSANKAVEHVLPGGSHHALYLQRLDRAAEFLNSLRDPSNEPIPVIFRPYHEHTGGWFWWGKNSCTRKEFIQLWQMTVDYLKEEKQLHNLLYAYSPNATSSRKVYLERYPGNDYVDVIGLDCYNAAKNLSNPEPFLEKLRMIAAIAKEFNKIPALTETGSNNIQPSNWFTKYLLDPIKSDPEASRIAYILVWRNWKKDHCFAPYPGHPSESDFVKFYSDPVTMFESDLPDMYQLP